MSYADKEACDRVMEKLNGAEIKTGYKIYMTANTVKPSVHKQAPHASVERISEDIKQASELISVLDKEKSVCSQEESSRFCDKKEGESDVEHLDRLIHYLRRVHLFCYYSGRDFADVEELEAEKNGTKLFLRSEKREGDVQKEKEWYETLDKKIRARIQNPKRPEVFTGKKMTEELIHHFNGENSTKVSEEKYRCKLCPKAFKAESFIHKHLSTKHPDSSARVVERAIEKQFLENFLCDPDKPVNPPTTTAPVVQPQTSYSGHRQAGGNRNHFPKEEEEEEEEDFKDPRPLSDYIGVDRNPNGVPSIDILLGISK